MNPSLFPEGFISFQKITSQILITVPSLGFCSCWSFFNFATPTQPLEFSSSITFSKKFPLIAHTGLDIPSLLSSNSLGFSTVALTTLQLLYLLFLAKLQAPAGLKQGLAHCTPLVIRRFLRVHFLTTRKVVFNFIFFDWDHLPGAIRCSVTT